MKEFVVYTAARLGLFLVAYGVVVAVYLLVAGTDDIPILWPLLVAAVLSSIGSVTLLRRQRDRFAAVIDARARRAAAQDEVARHEVGRHEVAPGEAGEGKTHRAEQ